MALTLKEYAAQNPIQEPELERHAIDNSNRDYREQLEARQQAEELKASILPQLEQGAATEAILLTAIKAIGILTNDSEWAAAGEEKLAAIYKDIAQQSILAEDAATAAQRLEQIQTQFHDKMKKQLEANIKKCRRLLDKMEEMQDILY